MGLIGAPILLYLLHRYLKYRASCTATVYYPPDPINPFANSVFPKAELDTCPNAIAELDGKSIPKELDGFGSAAVDQRHRSSIVSELEGSEVGPSDPSKRISLATTANETRWSDVSSLAPPPAHRAVAARPSIAESLQNGTQQQHHGWVQETLFAPRSHAPHRLSRPTSGLQYAMQVSEGDISLTPMSSNVGCNQQASDKAQTVAQDGTAANDVRETHEGELSPNPEEARKSGAAAQANEEAPAGEEVQAGEVAQESKTGNESEDAHTSGTKAQKVEDMQEGEEAREGESTHNGNETPGIDAKAQCKGQASVVTGDVVEHVLVNNALLSKRRDRSKCIERSPAGRSARLLLLLNRTIDQHPSFKTRDPSLSSRSVRTCLVIRVDRRVLASNRTSCPSPQWTLHRSAFLMNKDEWACCRFGSRLREGNDIIVG
jgi:hypothetical protein